MSGLLSQVLRLNHRTYDLWLYDVVTLKHEHLMYQNNRIRQMSVLFKTALLCYEQQPLTAATAIIIITTIQLFSVMGKRQQNGWLLTFV